MCMSRRQERVGVPLDVGPSVEIAIRTRLCTCTQVLKPAQSDPINVCGGKEVNSYIKNYS